MAWCRLSFGSPDYPGSWVYEEDSLEGQFLAGDLSAHEKIVRWISDVLSSPRFRLLRSEWADLSQSILQRLVESLRAERFDPTLDLRTYVQGIARYTARDALGRRIRILELADVDAPLGSAATDAEELVLTRELVQKVVGLLPDRCQQLLRLFFYDQRGYPEIAQELGIAVGAVRTRLFRCLERARERFRQMGLAPRGGP